MYGLLGQDNIWARYKLFEIWIWGYKKKKRLYIYIYI